MFEDRHHPSTAHAASATSGLRGTVLGMGAAVALLTVALAPAVAQDRPVGTMEQISTHMGEMSVEMPGDAGTASGADRDLPNLRFEPWQMAEELYREDIVFIMRHGPTDWSKRDIPNVAPTDCDNQRIMTEEGKEDMRELGRLMSANELEPSTMIVSEWCRNQETKDAILQGFADVDPVYREKLIVETSPDLNLLLSLQGAPTVTNLRNMITNWEGGTGGPLFLVTHFTNIAELTEFNVYEGEILVVDPKRDNRVLGYLRLNNSGPDVGHFNVE